MADTHGEGTRQRFLEVGLQLLAERGPVVGVTHIRLSEVADAAGFSANAGYRYWPSHKAFHDDLILALIAQRDHPLRAMVNAISPIIEERQPWQEAVRVGSAASLRAYIEDGNFRVWYALRASAFKDPNLRDAARERVDFVADQYRALLDSLMKFYGRRMKPPFTFENLIGALGRLLEGFITQALLEVDDEHIDREPLAPGVGRDWTLYPAVVETLLEAWTEPDD